MNDIFESVKTFLMNSCPTKDPLLLALSGGPDSLCLFYALLYFRKCSGIPFHAAHIDHGWRQESGLEAEILDRLASEHQVPFHLKALNPSLLKGNLEAACREERYAFFAKLNEEIGFQAVLTGHHQDDQAETIFKRLLEGAHWSKWESLNADSNFKGVRILRPFLQMPKEEIQKLLLNLKILAFDDETNRDTQFLRARMRETIFPMLNREFGKHIQKNMVVIGHEAKELTEYFNNRLIHHLDNVIRGPWGIFLDLQDVTEWSLVEIKFLLRLLFNQEKIFFSRDIIELASKALLERKANQAFNMGNRQLRIDRGRIFLIFKPSLIKNSLNKQTLHLALGQQEIGEWRVKVFDEKFCRQKCTSWKEGWKGNIECYLPQGDYQIGYISSVPSKITNWKEVKKKWSQAKVPAFLYDYFPLIWNEEQICHEFLTGKSLIQLQEGLICFHFQCCIS